MQAVPAGGALHTGVAEVVLVMGRTASGKTTTAERLAAKLGFRHLSVASYKRRLVEQYRKTDSRNEELRDKGLELAIVDSVSLLKAQASIVLDASFGVRRRRVQVVRELSPYASRFYYIYCVTTDLDATRTRMDGRKGLEETAIRHHASDWKVFEHVSATFEDPDRGEFDANGPAYCIFMADTFRGLAWSDSCDRDEASDRVLGALRSSVLLGPYAAW